MKKLLASLLIFALALCGFAFAEEAEAPAHENLVILYTNDVHCGIDAGVGYAGVAAYRKAYEANGYVTDLVDCGDAIQGGNIGIVSNGGYIVEIMNEMGYDISAIGNHEFDYGVDNLKRLADLAEYDYVCCNFTDVEGNLLYTPYVIRELAGWKIAFVGIASPESATKCNPTFFQNEAGEYIYSFNGDKLTEMVQSSVDAARAEGADIVIALSHLGTEFIAVDKPWTSSDVINATSGIDVVLDAHSHSTISGDVVLNMDGEEVLLTSTGTQLSSVGTLFITADEEGKPAFASELHDETIFQDAETTSFISGIKKAYNEKMQEVVAHTDYELYIYDPEAVDGEGQPIRIVRSQETNLADLVADALRNVLDTDIGYVNGGAVRAQIPAGDINMEQILSVQPFGNDVCVVEATGQQILDALEAACSKLPGESGAFWQISGMSYEVDSSIPSTVVWDDNGAFVSVEGDRRVSNVMVGGNPIDPEGIYTIGGSQFIFADGGDGMNMFRNDNFPRKEVMKDFEVFVTYIRDVLGGVIPEEYAEPYGDGRITIK